MLKGSTGNMDVILIDGDPARRAQVCAMIVAAGGSVAAFETAAQFDARPRWAPLYLVADGARALQSMTMLLSRYERPPYVVAYQAEPAIHDIVQAMKMGACDYIGWPFGPQAVRSRLETAHAREATSAARHAANCQPGGRPNPAAGSLLGGLRGLLHARRPARAR